MSKLRQTFIEKIGYNPFSRSEIYENVMIDQISSQHIQTFPELKSAEYRYQKIQLPITPRSFQLIAVTSQWVRTSDRDHFF